MMSNLEGITLCNRYFLSQKVGSGGMAHVYMAWDKTRSAKIAVKILRRDSENHTRMFQMFAKEAELLRKLEHPYIVRIYEFDREGEIFFLVMDWVEGTNLRQAIDEHKGPFSMEEVSHVLQPICSALNYAHQNQIFHCDIKPANILIHVDGRVLLTDFGVARLAAEEKGGGTQSYMAPEQIKGRVVGASTDVYGLGITMYEMLSGGQVPFRGTSPNSKGSTKREKVEWEHCNMPLPPLSNFNPNAPNSVINVVEKALNKNPVKRYPTILTLRDDFELACTARGSRSELTETKLKTTHREPPKSYPTPVKAQPPKCPLPSKDPYLIGRTGEWNGQIIQITRQGLTIGRSSHNQLRFQDRSVSRTHAYILRTRRAVYIRDENSSLGTYVNDQRITGPVRLRHGDIIQLGYYQVFEYLGR